MTPLQRVLLLLLVASTVVTDTVTAIDEGDWEYEEPSWFAAQLEAAIAEGSNLKRCQRRQVPPVQGEACSKGKVCYFGNKNCASDTVHPNLRCECAQDDDGDAWGSWSCQPENCPAICPVEPPSASTSLNCTVPGIKCDYGVDHCCGTTTPTTSCVCKDNGTFDCYLADECVLPACLIENWAKLLTYNCVDATDFIREDFPAMKVECVTGEVPTPIDDDLNRMYLVLDADGLVSVPPRVG